MKRYKTILLDMDGVIFGFTTSVIKQVNKVTGKNVTLEDCIKQSNWGLEKLWGMTPKKWWEAIDQNHNFWFELEPFPWAGDLYRKLQDYADEVRICSTPSQSPNCVKQKKASLLQHFGITDKDRPIFTKDKWKYADENTLLIDDAEHNVIPFIKHGGNAVLVPSDWNTKDLSFAKVWEVIKRDGFNS